MIGWRVAWAGILLAVLTGLYLVTGPLFPLLVSGVLVALPILQWTTAWFFWRRALVDPGTISLRIRTQDAVSLALASTGVAVLGVLAVARSFDLIPPVDRAVFLIGLSFSLLMTAAPAVNWLAVWRPWRPA